MHDPAAESTWPTVTASGRDADPGLPAGALEATAAGLGVGLRFGRYRLVDLVGQGGMGVVFAAHDDELDRRVAIKFVTRHAGDPASHARLLAEAQALARLSHPNVIHVYEVGEAAGRVYLAMEFVRGCTLRAWLAEPRAWAEVLTRFVDAGRGLAAAHAVGLVHCDFKPDNVLVGEDGRLRVLDFGLARVAASPPARATAERARVPPSGTPGSTDPASASSSPHAVASPRAGTPGYMAPEHHAGRDLDGRSDQFSFCVALYEGLVGQHPFAGATPTERLARVLRGEVQAAPGEARLPARLRRAVRRGLAVDPADRHPSMDALLGDLVAALPRPRGRWWAAAVASAGLTSAAWLLFLRAGDPAAVCAADARAAVDALWGPEPRAAVERAFAATELPFAADSFARVDRLLGARVDAWSAVHREACAAPADGPLARCAARHRRELAAWIGALREATPTTVEEAVGATAGLTDPRVCLDPVARRLAADGDDDDGARITAAPHRLADRLVRGLLDEARALELAGDHFAALAPARDALTQAEAAAHAPLEARAHLRLGLLHEHTGDGRGAADQLAAAFFTAESAGLPGLRAEAAVHLVHVTGGPPRPPEVDALWARLAEATTDALGEGALDLRAALLQHRSRVALAAGEPGRALVDLEGALEIEERRLGAEHPALAAIHEQIGDVLLHLDRPDEAIARHDRALAVAEATLGPEHPAAAGRRLARALARERGGDLEGALGDVLRVLTVWERAYGEHPRLIWPITCAGRLLRKLGRPADAAPFYARGLAIAERAHGLDHPEVARALIEAADLDRELARPTLARDALLRALAILVAADDAADGGPGDAVTWLDLGEALLAVDAAGPAGDAFERARRHARAGDDRAAAAFGLARALWGDPAERARARALADEARAAGPRRSLADAIDAWLAGAAP